MKLFLDDLRSPPDNTWEVVRSYEDFVRFIHKNDCPQIISFDHDLGEGRDGYDCAKYLVEFCLNSERPLPKYIVHSMNPVGRDNILGLLDCFSEKGISNG